MERAIPSLGTVPMNRPTNRRAVGALPLELLPLARRYATEFIEAQRPLFEADIRAHWSNRSLERWHDTYRKNNTRCQWLGWLACAKAQEGQRG